MSKPPTNVDDDVARTVDERVPGSDEVTEPDPAAPGDVVDSAGEPVDDQPVSHEPVEDEPWEDEALGDEPARRSFLGHLGLLLREVVVVVVMALTISFVVKSLLLQAFYIPSDSMQDTLIQNDRVVVSKLTPGPFDLSRGDVVVFADPGSWYNAPVENAAASEVTGAVQRVLRFVGLLPDTAHNHLIKRVVGLPGDRVVCCDAEQRLTVNGAAIEEPYVKGDQQPSATPFDITVPAGRIWVMGDNRGNSSDSRYHDNGTGREGSVPIDLVVGRAVALVWPFDRATWLGDYPATFESVPDAGAATPAPSTTPSSSPRPQRTPTATASE